MVKKQDSGRRPAWRTFCRQVSVLTYSNMKSRYRKTIAGFLWVILNPLIVYGVQSQVFSRVLKINVPDYYLFLLAGLLPWLFIAQTLEMGTPVFLSNQSLLKAFPVNPLVYLMAQVLDNFVNFLAAFFCLIIPLSFVYPLSMYGVLLLPVALFFLAVGVTGVVWVLATAQVFFRDTRFLVSFVLSISFFMTPIFYPIEYVPANLRWIVQINPFYVFIAPFRACLYDFHVTEFFMSAGHAAAYALLAMGCAYGYWCWKKNEVYLYL